MRPRQLLMIVATFALMTHSSMGARADIGRGHSTPSPVVHFEASDYTAGSTTWSNRVAGGVDGAAPAGGMARAATGVPAVVFAGDSSTNRLTGSIGSTTNVDQVSVEMWVKMRDSGSDETATGSMLFSWVQPSSNVNYNIYHTQNKLGFNVFAADLYGIDATSLTGSWQHIVFVMSDTGTQTSQKIYVNGVAQNLSCLIGAANANTACTTSSTNRVFNASGDYMVMDNPRSSASWKEKADLGMMRLYTRELTASEVQAAYDATKASGYLDITGPSVTSAVNPPSSASSWPVTYNVTFSEVATGIAASDFSNSGTATGCTFVPSTNSGSTVAVAITCATDGTVRLTLAANSVTDALANTGPSSPWSGSIVTVDTTPTTTTTTTTSTTTTTTAPSTSSTTSTSTTTTTAVAPTSSTTSTTAPATTSTTAVIVPSGTNSTLPQLNVTTTSQPTRSTTTSTTTTTTSTTTTTTTSTTTTSTTVPAMIQVSVPPRESGKSVVRIGGRNVEMLVRRVDNRVELESGTLTAVFRVVRADGAVVDLDNLGELSADVGDSVVLEIEGLAPGSTLEAQVHSVPVLVGRTQVDETGTVSAAYEIPEGIESGPHSFVLVGTGQAGEPFVLATGLMLDPATNSARMVTLLIAVPILGAILAALFLPAVLRRRLRTRENLK